MTTLPCVLPDYFDNFLASREWMTYAQDPYEEARRASKEPGAAKRTIPNAGAPRKPALLIFLGYPARSQAYYAERLESLQAECDRRRSGRAMA